MSEPDGGCRFPAKRMYLTRDESVHAAHEIRDRVESRGGVYETLHPYRCPDAEHWHLSHYPQGTAWCQVCLSEVAAFDVGTAWIVSPHRDGNGPCPGEAAEMRNGYVA